MGIVENFITEVHLKVPQPVAAEKIPIVTE